MNSSMYSGHHDTLARLMGAKNSAFRGNVSRLYIPNPMETGETKSNPWRNVAENNRPVGR